MLSICWNFNKKLIYLVIIDYNNNNYKKNTMEDKFTTGFLEPELRPLVTIEDPTNFLEIREKLDEWGFVIVKNILSEEEMEEQTVKINKLLLDSVNERLIEDNELKKVLTSIRHKKKPFPKESLSGLTSKGFLSTNNFPHSEVAWDLRSNEKVRQIYANLHKTDDLCVSLDVTFFTPDTKTHSDCRIWCHADQNIVLPKGGSSESYQGILYVTDGTTLNTTQTVLIPKSHTGIYEKLLRAIPVELYKGHSLYVVDIVDREEREEMYRIWHEMSRRIPVPKGGMIIFNSKTIHQGYQSGVRFAQTICWEPKEKRDEDAYLRKLQACCKGIATTHWASLGIHHGVSFVRGKKPKFSPDHHSCVFPLKPIKNVAVINDKICKGPELFAMKISTLEKNINPKYLGFL